MKDILRRWKAKFILWNQGYCSKHMLEKSELVYTGRFFDHLCPTCETEYRAAKRAEYAEEARKDKIKVDKAIFVLKNVK